MYTMNIPSAQLQSLETLRAQVSAIENERTVGNSDMVSGGAAVIDRILPAGGYRKGILIDWIAPTGCAADFLSMKVAKEAASHGGAIVIIDPDRQFFPVAAAAMGLPMEQLIVLQSSSQPGAGAIDHDLLWAIDQSLRCPAVAAVWGPLPKIDDRWSRRFQLSAESSGCLGLFVRPFSVARQPSWAEVQWLVSPAGEISGAATADPNLFFTRLQMVRCRGSHTGQSVLLSINTVTGSVRKARSEHEYRRSDNSNRSGGRGGRASVPGRFEKDKFAKIAAQAHSVPVAARVADTAIDRRRA